MPELTKKEILLKLRNEAGNQMRSHVDLVWNTAKYSISILSALLTVLVGILIFGIQNYNSFPDIAKVGFKLIIIFIPFFLILFTLLSIWNFKREYERIIEDVVVQAKIDDELGLSQESYRKRKRVFPDDKYILLDRWVNDRKNIDLFPTGKVFIKDRCKIFEKRDGKKRFKRTLYVYMFGISIFFIAIFIIFLAYGILWVISKG